MYGIPERIPVTETAPLQPINPYGWSKLFVERLLTDMAAAHSLSVGILRYFNVAGADPKGRTGQSTPQATHLIKVACQVAAGERDGMSVFGTDYATPDGTCVRDYIHVTDLARAHVAVYEHMHSSNESVLFNCGNGRGYSVLEVDPRRREGIGKAARPQARCASRRRPAGTDRRSLGAIVGSVLAGRIRPRRYGPHGARLGARRASGAAAWVSLAPSQYSPGLCSTATRFTPISALGENQGGNHLPRCGSGLSSAATCAVRHRHCHTSLEQ